ncbi:hypothetical protein ACFRMQ_11065 [Kitasatospora sp. NPDC056783]|uniref:hypothetical protein n=1 Tax=Kitasatospora sp. NPDC056783 TaxID=3345943 RepID=UPI0036AF2387
MPSVMGLLEERERATRQRVEVLQITNDAKASSYFQALMAAQGVKGRVRIEP